MNKQLNSNDKYFFFIFTLLFSWLIWVPLVITQVNVKTSPWFYFLIIGGASPSIFGIIFIIKNKLYSKKTFIKSFLSFKQVGMKNFVLLISVIIMPFCLSLIIDFIIFKNIPQMNTIHAIFSSPISIVLFFIPSIYSGPLSEEFGWRGFAAKILIKEYNFVKTGLIIGIIWSIWHYPLLFLNGQYQINNFYIYIPIRLLKEISLSMIILFFYKATDKSVLSAIIIHYLANVSVNLFAPISFTSNIIHTGLLLIVAISLIIQNKLQDNAVK